MINIFGGLTINGGAKFIADFFSVVVGMFGRTLVNTVLNIFGLVWNFITKYVWFVCKWVLGMLDAMQFGFTRLLGIGTGDTTLTFDDLINGAKDVIMPGGSNYYDHIMKIFRAAFGVAIVLMIIFTIVAMVLQEYNLAVNGYAKGDNKKGKFFKVLLTNIITIFLLPLIFYTVITGTSAILTSFYRALGTSTDVTIAGNVLAATTYDANRYRTYANANKRIPISISVYEMENSFGGAKGDAELLNEINKFEVQETLKAIAGAFSNDSFLPFEKSTVYNNGVWANYENYSLTYNDEVYEDLGGYFENFICTREQYYVMADFIDYCQLYNIDYYVKAMSEPDICWKYVDHLTVDTDGDGKNADIDEKGNALGDITLKVKYRDAATVNMETTANAAGGSDDNSYELQITTKIDYSSPISDALTTASKLLGIDGDTSQFNTMERDDTGDFTNLVSWATEKVLLKWSPSFNINNESTWTYSDQIIIYEYFRFEAEGQSTNNTLQNYTLDDFTEGVTIDALEMTYRNYNSNIQSYSKEYTIYCTKLNGTYYRVYKSDSEYDAYGHAYYMLDALDKNVDYFDLSSDKIVKIQKDGTVKLKLSSGFSINDSSTWDTIDQVLIYEYFKDLTLSNDLVKKYKFTDFKNGGSGVDFNKFKIGGKSYVYINGTYYELSGSTIGNDKDFLISTNVASTRYFGYKLTVEDQVQYGISSIGSINAGDKSASFIEIDDTDAMYQKYSSMNFRLSADFSFGNSDTWSFRDYAIIYLYTKYLQKDTSINVDSLKHLGLQGTYGRVNSTYYLQVKYVDEGTPKFVYFDVEKLSRTSELKITSTLDPNIFDEMNLGLTGVNLVTTYNSELPSDRLVKNVVETHNFKLSENFDEFDPETWSNGDYLMICLVNAGIINTGIDLIYKEGYNALVYEIDDNKYYRFGKESDENAFFISEKQLVDANYDVDKWFKADFTSFMLSQFYNTKASDLVFDETNFGGGAYVNKDNYILNIGGDISSAKNLQYKLAKELFDKGIASTDIEKLEYNYFNPEIMPDDITTRKYLDLMIYQKTGSIPTASNPYTSYIYNDGSKYWLLIKDSKSADQDIFVDVTSGTPAQCYSYSGKTLTYQVHTLGKKEFASNTDFNNYYDQYITTKTASELDPAPGTSTFRAYYYSDTLKGTTAASFQPGVVYSDVDMVLAKNGVTQTSNGYYTFEAYKYGENIYIKVKGDCYLGLGKSSSNKMYFTSNTLIPSPSASNVFTKDGTNTYESFGATKNKFDALLYSITGSSEQVTYDIYKSGSTEYIKVNNNFVKLDSTLKAANLGTLSQTNDIVEYLYLNFYQTSVLQETPIISSRYSGNLSLTDTWHTGIQIILKKFNISASSSNTELIITNIGEKCLLASSEDTTIYIKLAGLADASWNNNGTGYDINIVSTDSEQVKWRIYNAKADYSEPETAIYVQNDTTLVNSTNTKLVGDIDSTYNVENAPNTLKTHDMSAYTYVNLLSAYFDPNNTTKRLDVYYNVDEGKSYVVFVSFGEKYIVESTFRYTAIGGGSKTISLTSSIVDASNSIFGETSAIASDTDTSRVVGSIINEKNFTIVKKYTSRFLKDENNEALIVYVVQKDTTYYAIYGLQNTLLASNPIQYVKVTGVGTTSIVSNETDASMFKIKSKGINEISNWTIVDYTIAFTTGNVHETSFLSYVYYYDSKYYVKNDDNYILIPFDSTKGENVITAPNATQGAVDSSGSRKLIDLLRMDGTNVGFIEQRKDFTATMKSRLSAFETNYLAKYTNGTASHIKFSENFDVRDFSTWTIADYVLYYVIVNEYYGTGSASLEIPFTYIPNFMVDGGTISNLTYFDMFLAEAYKDGTNYKYFTDETYRNKVYNLYVYRDSNYDYYIKVKDSYFVKLSDYVSTNYAKMEIKSTLMGGTYTTDKVDEIDAKIIELQAYRKTSIGSSSILTSALEGKNFQTLANAHGTLGQVHYLLKQDPDTGAVEFDKVIEFSTQKGKSGNYFKYDKLYELYASSFKSYATTVKENELDIKVEHTVPGGVDFYLKSVSDQVFPDLEFKNYYYFVEDADKFNESEFSKVDTNIQSAILANGSGLEKAQIVLKLSTVFSDPVNKTGYQKGFKINDISTWTLLDYIIMREYSREGLNHNKFKDMPFNELYEDTYAVIYIDGENYYLYINGNFYNLKGAIKKLSPDGAEQTIYGVDEGFYNTSKSKLPSGVITASGANINNYNIRVLKETLELSISGTYNRTATYTRDENNISFVNGNVINFRYLDMNVANANYRIMVSRFGKYSTKTLIKKVSWVEKLMTDMQVLYPDLNWSTLIATDGWLDTLGDFTSAYTNGLYTGGDNASNTTAAGLVLSEFFMSVAKEVEDSYANYEYSSIFNEETIKALMLSLMGEENYNALCLEAEVFMDFFNSTFAPIIDDFAEEFGESIGENSLRLCAYKSYLATVLLSSDIGEYLYTIATRIYAEYTIGEYLANAGNDYAGYYSYVNNLTDEDGNVIDAFKYGTFNELVRYENEFCGKNNPTFTFNVEKAFNFYKDEDGKVSGIKYSDALNSVTLYDALVSALIKELDEDYKELYYAGYEISDQGIVVDAQAEPVSSYEGMEFPFCYMIHVYWSIDREIHTLTPSYLSAYRDYLDGTNTRWSILADDPIDGADAYFEHYLEDVGQMALYRGLTYANSIRLYIPTIVLGGNDGEGLLSKIKSLLDVVGKILNPFDGSTIAENMAIPYFNAIDMFRNNSQLRKSIEFIGDKSVSLYFIMGYSEDSKFEILDIFKEFIDSFLPVDLSPEASWNTILEFNDCLDDVIAELQDVRSLLPGEKTPGGSTRSINNSTRDFYSDEQIDKVLTSFQDLKFNVNQYITAQQRIDRMSKKAITFTLAQYGANYVSSGYQFNVRNKDYTFKNTVDPTRIAEYVYGGAFLESVGVGAQYTHPEFTGIVTASKVYDNEDKVLKTNLVTWPALRGFASNLADKTAELYFLTNLGDLDVGKVNGVKVDDNLGNGTLADKIAAFIKQQFTNNMGADATNALITRIGDNYHSLSLYLLSNSIDKEKLDGITFEDYKRLILKRLILNEQNEEETAEERANKYMTMFNMLGLQFEFTAGSGGKAIGRILYEGNLSRGGSSLSYNKPGYASGNVYAVQKFSNSTIDIVKTMSGLENRPTYEVLTREYAGTRPTDYFDEAYGDTFIVCTYKDGLYYPILASGSKVCGSGNYNQFYDLDGAEGSVLKHKFTSEYLDNDSYVIVAKGIITADGYPTAIRKYNNPIEVAKKKLLKTTTETYNAVTYYRTNVGGTFGEGKDLVNASRAINRVTTKNYTKYVYGTNFSGGIGGATTYTGKTNLKTFVSSDYEAKYVQSKVEYLLYESNSYGGISVLDDFSYFYVFGGQTWVLLVMSFITIIPVLINALGGVISRIFDLVILFIVSPLVISTNSLFPDGKNDIFKKWKKNVESVLWSAMGYIIGFSSFSILVPVIYNMNSFVDPSTFNLIQSVGGLGKYVKLPVVNGLVRALWVVTAVSVLERMPKLLLPVLTANHGDLNSPHPGLGGGGKKFTDKAKEVGSTLKDVAGKVGSVVSGRALLGAVQKAKSEALSMIPGYDQVKGFKEKVIDPLMDAAHTVKVEAEKRIIQAGLQAYGVDPMTAKACAEAVGAVENSRKKAQKEQKEKNEQYKKEFEQFMK